MIESSVWDERISRAVKRREDWADDMSVQKARDFFEGKQNIQGWPENEWITINKIYSHLMAQLPILYSIDPYFYVKLKKSYNPDPEIIAQYEANAHIRQANLNYKKGELKLKEKARLCIQDAHFAYGVMKVRFSAGAAKNPQAGQPIKDEEGNEIKDENGEVLIQPDTLPVNKKYVLSRVHPDNFIFDEDAEELSDTWKFCAERIKMKRSDAEKDGRFKQKVIRDMQPQKIDDKKKGLVSAATQLFKGTPQNNANNDILVFWEVYDLAKMEWFIIGEGAKDYVKDPDGLPPGVEEHPYSFLRFTMKNKSPYPIPPLSQGIAPQNEYNLSRSRILRHRKRFNRKYEVLEQGLIDPDIGLSQLESGEDGTYIRVQQFGVVHPIQDAPLDMQTYTELSLLNNDLVEVLGTPDNARSIASADSATEASLMDKRLEVREGDRLSAVIDFIIDIARKLDQLAEVHMEKDEAVRISGPQGEFWETVKADAYEEIDGEYEYSVNVGASQPRLPDIERAQWTAFMSQVVIPMPHILTAPNFLKRMAEMYHIEDEAALKELQELGKKIMSGQMPPPGNTGVQASQGNPASEIIGKAMGALGGNNNGGGAQT